MVLHHVGGGEYLEHDQDHLFGRSHHCEGHGEDALVVLAVGGEKGRERCVRKETGTC